jgi:hypothetical protein
LPSGGRFVRQCVGPTSAVMCRSNKRGNVSF